MTPYIAHSVFIKPNLRSSVQTWSIIFIEISKIYSQKWPDLEISVG